MAERKVVIPGQRTPFVDREGRVSPVWHRFLTDLYERTGGGPLDKVDLSAGAAETAIDAAADAEAAAALAAAAAAGAQEVSDELERRFDFGFDFDLR